ncbi:serine/threonine-protein phosphatase 6 regulatory ankyrin repeat subunit C-like [Lingula anatina]|uniref:Serine/threonine-protein phosphatase 6 regulatory ankyrin repeat subunit C-like n=1 Tax=Lingula anatina TaxID=7574 RepID=A0A1S3K529_LINAN|nr:serine/threonine-protein phosphatase 6 regulatory ankyrin repeat subunit C-like [Lingula anatina]|eukprot:XP_013417743.1 serine/threonine-protein phosphatase 6 regulatory ankyrin repeat subunit C-like [Lingula anatina]
MSLQQHLNTAVKTGNVAMVERLIVKGADIDHGFGMQGPPLCAAINANQSQVVQVLIQAKCNLNVQDYDGESPLCLALRKGFVDIAKMLIQGGCRVNREDPISLKPPIIIATEKELMDIVQLLVNTPDCDVNKKDKTGSMALHYSVTQNSTEISKLLISSGRCRVNICNQTEGENPLHIACRLGHKEAVELLLSTANEGHKKELLEHQQQQLLHCQEEPVQSQQSQREVPKHSQQQKQLQFVETEIGSSGSGDDTHEILDDRLAKLQLSDPYTVCDVNRGTHFGVCPLHFACIHNHTDIAKLLIGAGSDVNAKTTSNKCPLHHAVQNENFDIVDMLLEAGANINDVAWYGQGPQFRFWKTSSIEEKGTPLHLAVATENLALVRKLLEKGADLSVGNQDGQSPIMLSLTKCSGKVEIAVCLLSEAIAQGLKVSDMKDLQGNTLVHAVSHVKNNPGKLLQILVESGCDLDKPNNEGMRPIHSAIYQSNYNAVKALLDCGCSVNATICESSFELQRLSPLHVCAMNGLLEVAKLLISYGADIDAHFDTTEESDDSDLDLDNDPGIEEGNHGANSDDNEGKETETCSNHQDGSALTLALENMNVDIVRLLVEAGMNLNLERYLFSDDASLEELFDILNFDLELKMWILEHLYNPLPLSILCRRTIRSHFTHHCLRFQTESLPLPQKLKCYLRIFPLKRNDETSGI